MHIGTYVSISTYMDKEKVYSEKWVDEKTAAQHFKVSPGTLRKRRAMFGHDTKEVWTKFGGKVLYDLWASDKRIEKLAYPGTKDLQKHYEWCKTRGYA